MSQVRPRIFLALVALAAVGWGTRACLSGRTGRDVATWSEEELGPAGAPPTEGIDLAALAREDGDEQEDSPTVVAELGRDAVAVFGTSCDLQLLAEGTNLRLSGEQWSALAAAYLQVQAVRQTYEAEIAQVSEVAPGRHRLEIPAYPEAGHELRRQFQSALLAALGPNATARVMTELGTRFEGRFAGFGTGQQTIEILGDPLRAPAEVEVRRTARYWSRSAAGDRAVERREIHFPTAEDPAGESWPALLALVTQTD